MLLCLAGGRVYNVTAGHQHLFCLSKLTVDCTKFWRCATGILVKTPSSVMPIWCEDSPFIFSDILVSARPVDMGHSVDACTIHCVW